MPSGTEERYCPICEERMFDSVCPTDGVNTIRYSVLEASSGKLDQGTIIADKYRVESLVGSGAMGSVYEATQVNMGRRIALKALVRDSLRDGTELRRFFQEAQSSSRLKHPNVVQVYDFGIDETTQMPFIAMELIEGRTLRRVIAEEAPLGLVRTARILEQVSKALVTAHQAGLIHRDLKPDNIMVRLLPGDEEHVTVLDFGIAKATRTPGGLHESLTATGVVVGTPRYMSPEQVRGRGIDVRSDLYSLGCILHEMLSGQAPFTADDAVSLMLKHVNAARPPLPEIVESPEMIAAARVLHEMLLSREPDDRPLNATRAARVFKQLALGRPPVDVAAELVGQTGTFGSDALGSGPGRSSREDVAAQTGDTDTHVKARPEHTPTPVDSRMFDSVRLSGLREPGARPRPEGRSSRRGLLLAVVGAVSAGVGLYVAGVWDPGVWDPEPEEVVPAHPDTVRIRVMGERDAVIFQGSQRLGTIPTTLELPWSAEPTSLRFEKSGHEVGSEQIRPNEDQSLEVDLPLLAPPEEISAPEPEEAEPPHPATVEIEVTGERDAVIYRGSKRLGRVPTTLTLPWSDDPVWLRFEKSGHRSRSQRIRPNRNQTLDVNLPLRLIPRP